MNLQSAAKRGLIWHLLPDGNEQIQEKYHISYIILTYQVYYANKVSLILMH